MSGAFDIQEETPVTPTTAAPANGTNPDQLDADLDAVQSDPNASDWRKFVNKVKKRGRESARGKDSLPALVGDTALAVASGALDPKEKHKHPKTGEDVSAAKYIFYTYAEEEGNKAIHARTAGSVKSQESKLQQVITAAARPAPANFCDVLDRALKDIKPRLDAKYESKALKPAFDAYVSLARLQKTKDTLDDSDIEKAWLKPTNGDVNSIDQELAKAHRVLKKVLGDGTKDGVKVEQSDVNYPVLSAMEANLLAVIRSYDPEYDVPKPSSSNKSQVTSASNGNGDEDEEEDGADEVVTTDTPPVTTPPESEPVQTTISQ